MAFLPESFCFFSSPVSSAPGHRLDASGALGGVGNHGYSWSSTSYGSGDHYRGMYLYFNATALYLNNAFGCGYGFPLRCLSE